MYVTDTVNLVGVNKVYAQKLNTPDYQNQSRCGQ